MEVLQARIDSFLKSKRIKKQPGKASSSVAMVKWPHPDTFKANPSTLAEAGFFFDPTWDDRDSVSCFLCGKCLSDWEDDDDPFDIHYTKCRSSCPWAIVRCGIRDDLDEEGVYVFPQKARIPSTKAMEKARLGTYRDLWTHDAIADHSASSKKMASAGFVFTPQSSGDDTATCFYCDLSLSGWDQGDDPVLEHRKREAKTGLQCPFFTGVKLPALPSSKNLSKSTSSKPPSKAKAKTRASSRARSRPPQEPTSPDAPEAPETEDELASGHADEPPPSRQLRRTTSKRLTNIVVVEVAPKLKKSHRKTASRAALVPSQSTETVRADEAEVAEQLFGTPADPPMVTMHAESSTSLTKNAESSIVAEIPAAVQHNELGTLDLSPTEPTTGLNSPDQEQKPLRAISKTKPVLETRSQPVPHTPERSPDRVTAISVVAEASALNIPTAPDISQSASQTRMKSLVTEESDHNDQHSLHVTSIPKIVALTEKEREMTVEQWIRHEIELNYAKLLADGQQQIALFKQKAADVRRRIENL